MRQVFSSPRLENVEGVARLLNEQGIETYVSQARGYKGQRRTTFSYAESGRADTAHWPAVWIVRAEDQPRAREMLREAGLLTSTSKPISLPEAEVDRTQTTKPPLSAAWVLRLRLLVLAAIAGITLMIYRHVISG
ncbi:MAG: pathogenicity-like protein [Gammaproteobacteria bacterium HGW-Gammaproteobacteria-2]|jgi:hypothetical protein|nr:MAG: pathogenicity-like protein [Gammaproteobacteria bacterium HGW-Gammaproteobacteria-2]